MVRNFPNGDDAIWLIGDSGYAQQLWLMTLFYQPLPVVSIVNTCAVLHNMCMFVDPEGIQFNGNTHHLNDLPALQLPAAVDIGGIRRNIFVQNYFTVALLLN
ncbi:hypothetical protein JTB14_007232 [Gonioctena quinquepunctata]|nr:hypothetical protein JTB14_007232 [Gonioctena quinquepunctata]